MFPWRMPDNWAGDVTVSPLLKSIVGDVRPRLLLLSGAVGLVLLIACANVANLMLARAAARQREMSLRSALGADTRRLIRQMLTESAVLAVISGGLGVLLAAMSLNALKLVLPPDTPRLANLGLHGGVFLFAAGVSILTGILSGTGAGIPGREARSAGCAAARTPETCSAMRGGSRSRRSWWSGRLRWRWW